MIAVWQLLDNVETGDALHYITSVYLYIDKMQPYYSTLDNIE